MPASVGSLRSDRRPVCHGWSGFSGTGCWGELDDIRPLHGMSRNDVILTPGFLLQLGLSLPYLSLLHLDLCCRLIHRRLALLQDILAHRVGSLSCTIATLHLGKPLHSPM